MQADLKTFHQHGVYGCAAITLLTVQNTVGVKRLELMSPALVGEQIEAVLSDIVPHAIKTGALGSVAIIERVADRLRGTPIPLVIDPVGFSKNGSRLTEDSAREVLLKQLLPLATLITPNLDEAAWLTQRELSDEQSFHDAVQWLVDAGARAVLLKGGHRADAPVDLLWLGGVTHELRAERIDTRHTHGAGCTLSAAITARLALGHGEQGDHEGRPYDVGDRLLRDVGLAKQWITEAIASAPGLGAGQGPLNHFAKIPS